MADKEPEAAKQPAGNSSPTSATAAEETQLEPGAGKLQQQRVSGILKAVLDHEEASAEAMALKRLPYPWVIDVVLGIGLLIAVGGFSLGMFKMYVTHQAQNAIVEGNYQAAIHLLKGSPLPIDLVRFMGVRDEDPEEILAHALYLDAMHRITDKGDIKGAKDELQQIREGTHEFEQAQKILLENFQPSSTQLTGGVVQNAASTGTSK
ncbi:MAG TPA: hypothetical protein V6D22_19490 [Candidatus Obscuribacterales bacterium]